MPRNLARLDLTRPLRRALLSRLLDIVDGEHAVLQVYNHASLAARDLLSAETNPDLTAVHRAALITEALSSARAALPGLEAMVVQAEKDVEQTRRHEASLRRWHTERPAAFPRYEQTLGLREKDLTRARARVSEMRAIIAAHAPDEDLVGKHSADLAEAALS